ncbi:MAG: NnrU family protein, partial [Alphaproteobacteria bacterium]
MVPAEAKGVFAITRHPMMWAFAMWGLAHILVYPVAANIIVSVAIILLSLVGAALQDRKKEVLTPAAWQHWESRTSYWPFAAILAGRARFGRFGMHALAGGLVVWLAATWAHMPLAGWPAGIWRWLG